MKRATAVFLLMILTLPVMGKDSDYVLPKDLLIVLPKDGSVSMEWVAPPLSENKVRAANLSDAEFHLSPTQAVWMRYDKNIMVNLASGTEVVLQAPLNDFIWLDDGALFVTSDKTLGFIPELKQGQSPYQPICEIPVEQARAASDGKNRMFVYGYDAADKSYAVYTLLKGFNGWRKVFSSKIKITAVCADTQAVYVAAGRMIYKIEAARKKASLAFVHPLDPIIDIACLSGGGIFYATNNGVGAVRKGGLEFMKCKNTQIEIKNRMLYVYMPDNLGVMRFKNIERLTNS